ncbi:collagen alpha-2(I) chain-like [Canis lupus familiaris]|uniref:collagen alpha-2(I) chain-like n=1 Tax=Canis lupus familiaris TaxID=9615 RepID=UPI0018F3D9D2|nr:collagen alpha-2(I) chain-like [Canis lupus familiaris]
MREPARSPPPPGRAWLRPAGSRPAPRGRMRRGRTLFPTPGTSAGPRAQQQQQQQQQQQHPALRWFQGRLGGEKASALGPVAAGRNPGSCPPPGWLQLRGRKPLSSLRGAGPARRLRLPGPRAPPPIGGGARPHVSRARPGSRQNVNEKEERDLKVLAAPAEDKCAGSARSPAARGRRRTAAATDGRTDGSAGPARPRGPGGPSPLRGARPHPAHRPLALALAPPPGMHAARD